MSALDCAFYRPDDATEWDALVRRCPSGCFLHTRRFLSYHGTRFVDRSLVFRDRRNALVAVLPAAEAESGRVVSHSGATFGGFLADPSITGSRYLDLVSQALDCFAAAGLSSIAYKPTPYIYSRFPSQEDLYALWRAGFTLQRRTLSECIDLDNPGRRSDLRRRTLARAVKAGCILEAGPRILEAFWPILEANLRRRHSVSPVHSLAEIIDLIERFPEEIECFGAYHGGGLVGGVVLFHSPMVTHVQYSVASEAGFAAGAMDFLVNFAIDRARGAGRRYFDFGISTDATGEVLNEGLHSFKMGFGAGVVVYEMYTRDL